MNPHEFMVILFDLEKGDEYVLQLTEEDIFVLTEGFQGILKDEDSTFLTKIIIDNLDFVSKDGATFLTCQHKVFFISLW